MREPNIYSDVLLNILKSEIFLKDKRILSGEERMHIA
jgi:hypothetical protein